MPAEVETPELPFGEWAAQTLARCVGAPCPNGTGCDGDLCAACEAAWMERQEIARTEE